MSPGGRTARRPVEQAGGKGAARKRSKRLTIGGVQVGPGETRDAEIEVSQTALGLPVVVPLRVIRAREDGPRVVVTAAVHGDELNGTGVVRDLLSMHIELRRGALVLLPVVNVFGFERHSRYLPDRRDLNRCFPGRAGGNQALRLAHAVMTEVIEQCDFGIDLHTATAGRTNYPHLRANLKWPGMRPFAEAFGCEVIRDVPGDEGSLRRAACNAGCLTVLLEAGEALKIEPGMVDLGVRGVLNVLRHLGMIEGEVPKPAYQTISREGVWARAQAGGILRFHVAPGELVAEGDVLATCEGFFRDDPSSITAPVSGVLISMTTLPVVRPGDPVAHVAVPDRPIDELRRAGEARPKSLHRRIQRRLAANVRVDEPVVAPRSRRRARR